VSKQPVDLFPDPAGAIHHLTPHRKPRAQRLTHQQDLTSPILSHFREQHESLLEQNRRLIESHEAMHAKIDRLTNGIDRLVQEMHGIRTGAKDEAFARVAGFGCPADLPTVRPEAALIYTLTAAEIGAQLGFRASEIGALLGQRGLKWADNSDFQEITRRKRDSQTRYWVADMPRRLSQILDTNNPSHFAIQEKAVLAIFRKWARRKSE
jgi:hypothetical protein